MPYDTHLGIFNLSASVSVSDMKREANIHESTGMSCELTLKDRSLDET